jgi:ketosteroid isomerase-like protein
VTAGTTPELEEFLATGLKRQIDADFALHDGDPEPRLALWSEEEPVTLFGAAVPVESGRAAVEEVARWLATRMSQSHKFDVELVAAGVSGDLAYTVGFEHSEYSFDGGPVQPAVLRVTHIYRREAGEWRIVHRHGDHPPVDRRPERPSATEGQPWS